MYGYVINILSKEEPRRLFFGAIIWIRLRVEAILTFEARSVSL